MRFLHLLFLAACAVATPLLRQQTPQTPPDVVPDAELLPAPPSPSPIPPSASPLSPSPIPAPSAPPSASPIPTASLAPSPTAIPSPTADASPQPTVSAGTSPTATAVAPSPTPSPSTDDLPLPPGVVPGDTDGDGVQDDFDGDGLPDDVDEPQPSPFIEGDDSNRAALAGGITAGIFALLVILLCIFCFVLGGKKQTDEGGTGVYTSTEAGVDTTTGGETTTQATGGPGELEKDAARDLGPAAAVGAAAAAAGVVAAGAESEAVVPRGPTPPPHDYVLGAGPAATRKDFVDLRTKFERDEIGDNSAVLGVERTGVVGEGLERDMTPAAVETGAGGAVLGATALPHETESGPAVDIKPEGLPDRGGPVPITFDSQERLMAGGDGSGAISDAAMSLNAASIAEESGDVPSLERDPIIRDRDQTF